MDASHTNNATHVQHGSNDNADNAFGDFLGGMQNYATNGDPDEIQFFHPDLFDSQDFSNSVHGQAQPQQQQQQHQSPPQQRTYPNATINQSGSGGSQSPALPAFNQSQQQYSQPQPYPQPLYDQRNMYAQQAYDPRIFQQRPSHSPAPMEQYGYPSQYAGQSHQGLMNIQPRPSPSPASQYPPRQQTFSPYINFDSHGPTLPQRQDPDMMQFANFRGPGQTQSHAFVNPSMLDGTSSTGHYPQMQRSQQPQQMQGGLYYPKPDAAIPQSFPQQAMNQGLRQSMQQNQMQMTHPSNVPQANTLSQPATIQQHMAAMAQQANAAVQPKKPRGRPRKDGKLTKSNGGTASSESDSELEVEDELPEPPPAMIAVSAPTDPRAKAVYDALQAVWSPRNKTAPMDKIKIGIVQFGEVIRGVRDQWKTRNDNLKMAEADQSATAHAAPDLRQETAQYRQTMENLVNRCSNFGHPTILRSLGEVPYTLSALYSFMLDRVSAADYNSTLLLAIFRLAVKFTTVDEEKLESGKWTKLLQRVTKKGSTEGKALAEQILANAKKQTATKAEGKNSSDPAAGTKRAREGDSNGPVPKKVVRPSSKPLAVQNAEKRRVELLSEAAKKGKPATTSTAGGTLITPAAAKPKPPIKATTTTSFSALMSASKKPGTTNAERAAAKLKDGPVPAVQQVKREPVKRESPPASTAVSAAATTGSSFLSNIFSSMDKKEEVKPVEEEEDTGETPDEKSKRLRKESRRKLRVSWKNDADLVETRFFTHDPNEEINQGDSAKKDAGDTGKEGEMLKRHQGMADLEDEDEDDDDDDPDFDPDCYTSPSEVDFSEIASEDNDPAINGVKHGGTLAADSKAKEAQSKFEESVLMVFYSESDRPDSPKEPAEEADDDFTPSDDFGEPEDKVRNREKEIYARRQPQGVRLDGASDFGLSLQSLTNNGVQQYLNQPVQPSAHDLLARLAQPAQQQPAPATNAAPSLDWQSIISAVTNKTNISQSTPAPAIDLKSILGSLQAQAAQSAQPTPVPAYGLGNYSSDDYGNTNTNTNTNGNGNGKPKPKKGKNPVPLDANGLPLNYKTRVCEFWEKGMCSKGDNCTFKHSR